jgi:hypothetical protein
MLATKQNNRKEYCVNQFNMLEALHAKEPAHNLASGIMLYGQFVGSWEGHAILHESENIKHEAPMEVHFDWVLKGKAIQDVWIAPSRSAHYSPEMLKIINLYGTTIRVYDPDKDLWNSIWINPATQTITKLIGRKVGDDIVNEIESEEDNIEQWMFSKITDDSFHWIARKSDDNGKTWNIKQEFFLKRSTAR